MYACVSAREGGLLVSNDLLRDHIFSLLRPKHFLKWCERHIAGFYFRDVANLAFELEMPPPYSRCVQQLANGAWMLPGGGHPVHANMSTASVTAPAAPGGQQQQPADGGEEDAEAAAANAYEEEEFEPEWWLCVRPVAEEQGAAKAAPDAPGAEVAAS